MIEYLTDLLKCHSLGLSVTEGNEHETREANAGIESKGTARSHTLHHSQESGRDDEVSSPASHGVDHGSHSTNFQRQTLCANPRDRSHARGEEGNVENDGDKHEDARPVDLTALQSQSLGVDRNVFEGDSGQGQNSAPYRGR